jgi:hypothetical protein
VARGDERRAILTRERAFEDAWITYQNVVNKLSPNRIAQLAVIAAVRLADGSFSHDAGLGKHIAERTIRWRLAERREQLVEDLIARPITDMIAEELQALEEEQAWWATMSRPIIQQYVGGQMEITPNFLAVRVKARENLLRVMESRRKLLGIDRPQQVEITHTVEHDDPATTKLRAAMVAAKAKMDADLAEAQEVEGE